MRNQTEFLKLFEILTLLINQISQKADLSITMSTVQFKGKYSRATQEISQMEGQSSQQVVDFTGVTQVVQKLVSASALWELGIT